MKEIMQELDRLSSKRPLEIVKDKKEGKKVVEYFGDFVPEQWIVAAGMDPFLICKGGDPQPPEATLDYMLRFMNPLAATMAGAYLMNLDPVMPIADCVAIQQSDCHYGRMSEILEYKGVPVYKIGVPADNVVGISQEYYRNELKEFRAKLEEIAGHPISDDDIRANYAKTNKINELLRKIDELRKKDNPPITFSDFIKLNHYTYRVSYDESIANIEDELAKAEDDETREQWQQQLDEMTKWRDEYEQNYRWSASAESIELYRSYADYLTPTQYIGFDEEASEEFYSLMSQYIDGSIDLDTFLTNIDKKIRMMVLEDM